jgi:hypothetical protein
MRPEDAAAAAAAQAAAQRPRFPAARHSRSNAVFE